MEPFLGLLVNADVERLIEGGLRVVNDSSGVSGVLATVTTPEISGC